MTHDRDERTGERRAASRTGAHEPHRPPLTDVCSAQETTSSGTSATSPGALAAPVLDLQRSIGNQATMALLGAARPAPIRSVVQRVGGTDLNELEAFYLREIRRVGDPYSKRNLAAYARAKAEADLDRAKGVIRQHVAAIEQWNDREGSEDRETMGGDLPLGGLVTREERYYLALNDRLKMLLATVQFGAAVDLYNPEFWERSRRDEDALLLRAGKSPSEAIAELHRYSAVVGGSGEPKRVALDCVEFIEVAMWLAELDVVGRRAFDAKYGGRRFRLAAPGSTGIAETSLAVRRGGDGDDEYDDGGPDGAPADGIVEFTDGPRSGTTVGLGAYLSSLPFGSRVMWRTFDEYVPDDADFKNENTVKIGEDLYAAHPIGTFSLSDMATEVAKEGYEAAQQRRDHPDGPVDAEENAYYEGVDSVDAYLARFVRIVEIETFKPPV